MNKHFQSALLFVTIFVSSLLLSCEWPYDPEKQDPPPDINSNSQTLASGKLYLINPGMQTCNPSISQDLIHYPACMLWLGFEGSFVVKVLSQDTAYYHTSGISQHDRLTICDSSNTVRWYILRENLGIPNEIQDPEWSTHPDYITCLGKDNTNKWDCYVIRLSDKKFLKICENAMEEYSTPHIWLPDTCTNGSQNVIPIYDPVTGFVTKESIAQFFGTTKVKIVYTKPAAFYTLHYVDYEDSIPAPRTLLKPEGKTDWKCEDPLFSPEGNWIAYNCYPDLDKNDIYMQRVKQGSAPILLKEKAYEPHWWVDPNSSETYYVIYSVSDRKFIDGSIVFTNPEVEKTGSAGSTYKLKLRGSAGDVPAHMGLTVDASSPQLLVNLPFNGGLSRDGVFICTGYSNTYILQLP